MNSLWHRRPTLFNNYPYNNTSTNRQIENSSQEWFEKNFVDLVGLSQAIQELENPSSRYSMTEKLDNLDQIFRRVYHSYDSAVRTYGSRSSSPGYSFGSFGSWGLSPQARALRDNYRWSAVSRHLKNLEKYVNSLLLLMMLLWNWSTWNHFSMTCVQDTDKLVDSDACGFL